MKTITPRIAAILCSGTVAVASAADTPASAPSGTSVPPELIKFHGHECPGVTMGYRMASEALKALPEEVKVAAIAEHRFCGVDALQWVTGCTAGKSNLQFKDYGKLAFTLYDVETKKGVRIFLDTDRIPAAQREDRSGFINWLLSADAAEFLTIEPVEVEEQDAASTRDSSPCAVCGEAVRLTHLRESDGRKLCIPCSEKASADAR